MAAPSPVTPDDLARWRTALKERGEEQLLAAELARARVEFATKAAKALRERLSTLHAYGMNGCPSCHDAEAQAFLAKLDRIASGG